MADLDPLVSEADESRACRMLEALGFQEAYATEKHRVFLPLDAGAVHRLGEHSDNPIKIELHSAVWERLPRRRVELSDALFPAQARPGSNDYRSPGALMTHLLLHAAGAMTMRALRLLHLHDIARLATRMTDADWSELLAHDPWWAWPPLHLTARYFSGIPMVVLTETAARCPWFLKHVSGRNTLSDLSLSSLWLEAFPGIEWARSPQELLELAVSRLRPGAEVIRMRRVLLDEPYNSESAWARKSQLRRMMTWATTRQPRVPTLHVVRSTLALTQ